MTITLRIPKGSPLTHEELDGNFTDLDTRVNGKAATAHTHVATDINDSTLAGRSMLTAASDADQRALLNVEDNAAADQNAAEVPFTPAGTIAATNVQAAIEEVASEAGGGPLGDLTDVGTAPPTLHHLIQANGSTWEGILASLITGDFRGAGVETLAAAFAAVIGAGGLNPDDASTAITIGDLVNGTHRRLTSDSTITLTLDAQATVNVQVAVTKAGSGAVNVVVEGGAGYWGPGTDMGNPASTTGFEVFGYTEFLCVANSDGNSARFVVYGQTSLLGALWGNVDCQNNDLFNIGANSSFETPSATRSALSIPEVIIVPVSDETTALTVGLKRTFRMPFGMALESGNLGIRASVTTAPTGANVIVGIKESGVTILSTNLSIDASEKTSLTAATVVAISDSNLADDAEIELEVLQIGSSIAGAGLKVQFHGVRA